MGNGSMLTLEGDLHRRERRLMMPMFHGDRMKAYGESMQRCALDRFNACRANEKSKRLDMMTGISLEIIVRTIFGGSDSELVDQSDAGKSESSCERIAIAILFSASLTYRSWGFRRGIVGTRPKARCSAI